MVASTVFFATNRVATVPLDQVASYGNGIQPPSSPTGLIYGTAFIDGVDLPTNAPGTVSSLNDMSVGGFSANAIGDLADAGRNLLVFIHGFDNSFSDALTQAAFNREWLAALHEDPIEMSVISFSWPSLGQLIDGPILPDAYKRDQGMARQSDQHVMSFFANLEPILTAARTKGRKTYLLVHSMGHIALQGAVESWFLHGNGQASLFDTTFLAAGDCGSDTFNQPNLLRLSGLSQLSKRVVIYFSSADLVLQLSFVVNAGAPRLGQRGPDDKADTTAFPPSVYEIVDATGFNDYDRTFLGSHQYYRRSPACRRDIASRL